MRRRGTNELEQLNHFSLKIHKARSKNVEITE